MRGLIALPVIFLWTGSFSADEVRIKKAAVIIQLPGKIADMALAPDAKTVASATFKGPITLWDVSTGKKVREFESVDDGRSLIAFSSDGNHLVGCGRNAIKVWDTQTGETKHTYPGKSWGRIGEVMFSPSGKTIAFLFDASKNTSGVPTSLTMWDLASNKLKVWNVPSMGLGNTELFGFAFSLDGQSLLYVARLSQFSEIGPKGGTRTATTRSASLFAFDFKTSKTRSLVPAYESSAIGLISSSGFGGESIHPSLSPDGKTFLFGDTLADLSKGKIRQREDRGRAASLSADGKMLLSHDGMRLWLYDAATWEMLADMGLDGSGNYVGGNIPPAFSPDGRKAIAPYQNMIRVWDISSVVEKRKGK
jgi:WD40 repeat protein